MLSEDVEPTFTIFFHTSRYSRLARARARKDLKNELSPQLSLSLSVQVFDPSKRINFVKCILTLFLWNIMREKDDGGFRSGKSISSVISYG